MKLFLATPSYDGQVCEGYKQSLEETLRLLKEAGIPVQWETFIGCCYLPVSRNKLIKQFLDESEATDFFFLDADLSWNPEAFMKILEFPVEIVGGAYPFKSPDERYPVWIRTDENDIPLVPGRSKLIEAWTIPTGFMRITRRAFQRIEAFYGEDELRIDEYSQDNDGKLLGSYLNFFDTVKIGNKWWGEDTNFCRKWTFEMKMPLYVYPNINFTHWGKTQSGQDYPFRGNFHDWLLRQPGGSKDVGYRGSNIKGFMTSRELEWLYFMAKQMNSVVEIGCFEGRSSHAILSGCKGRVVCVDPWEDFFWKENGGSHLSPAEEIYRKFLDNTEQFKHMELIRARSFDAAQSLNGDMFDMVFIDGDHKYESVEVDIDEWLPKTRKLICGHDYADSWPDVKSVVDDRFGDKVKVMDTIWYVELDEEK